MTVIAAEAPLDLRPLARRAAWPVAVVAALVVGAVVLAALGTTPAARPLDPRDASPQGARAVAELLRQRGVSVVPVADPNQLRPGPDTTVVVPDAFALTGGQLTDLRSSGGDVVVIGADADGLAALDLPADVVASVGDVRTLTPRCSVDAAVAAGDVRLDGFVYRPAGSAAGCYPSLGGDALLVQEQQSGGRVAVIGGGAPFTNRELAHAGDAALALGLTDRHARVQWLLPTLRSQQPTSHRQGLLHLLPANVLWATLQLLLAVALLALWRARRLGPLVDEPLPVVVRATETVEGRARLLQAARARGASAEALRAATRRRLAGRLGLAAAAPPAVVVTATAAHAGRAPQDVHELLYGAAPTSDEELVTLASTLDELETQVTREPGMRRDT